MTDRDLRTSDLAGRADDARREPADPSRAAPDDEPLTREIDADPGPAADTGALPAALAADGDLETDPGTGERRGSAPTNGPGKGTSRCCPEARASGSPAVGRRSRRASWTSRDAPSSSRMHSSQT